MPFIKSRKHAAGLRSIKNSQLPLAASLVTALAFASPASASTTSPAGTGQVGQSKNQTLPTVEVTATGLPQFRSGSASDKFVQPLLETPQTVQIITSDLFHQQGATSLAEVLRNSPGVGAFYAGENGSTTTGDAVRMRGFDASGSIFVDGIRDRGSVTRDVFNIEQVEVTKGPDGTEYGRTAPAGAINMVTKQPFLREHTSASISLGSGDHKRVTADWNQPLGEHSALRLNVMKQDSGVPGRDVVKHKRWGIAPSLAFGLGTATRTYIDFLHIVQDNTPDGGVPTIGLPGYTSPDPARPQIGQAPMVDPSNFYGTAQDHDKVQSDMFTLRVEHDLGNTGMLRNTTRWQRTRQYYLLMSFMGSSNRLLTPDLDDPGSWALLRTLPNFKHQQNTTISNQTNLRLNLASGSIKHHLSAGIELIREGVHSVDVDTRGNAIWPPANLYNPDHAVGGVAYGPTGAWSKGHTDTYAAYLFDAIEFSPRWQLNLGLRLDHYRIAFQGVVLCESGRRSPDCPVGVPAGSAITALDTTTSGQLFNWKAGVLYKPADNGSIYLNLAQSAQPPGGQSLALSTSNWSADNPAFDPQTARTTELGTKWELFDRRLLLSAAAYRTVVGNQVERDPVDLQYYQTGEKRVQGVELSAVGHISRHWAVSLGYTKMDAEVTEGRAVANDGSSTLAYTPDAAFTAWTSYQLPFRLTLAGGARYNGSMKRGHDGAQGTPEEVRPYWVFNLMASYPVNRQFSLQLNVNNVFDNSYVAAINKSGYRYTPGQPRSFLLTANFTF